MSSTSKTQSELCLFEELQLVFGALAVTVNIVSVLINIIHIFIIRNAEEKNYFWILVQISVADVVSSCIAIASVIHTMPSLILLLESSISWHVADGLAVAAICCRCNFLALASFDSNAICRHFKYTSSKVLNNIRKVSLIVWISEISYCLAQFFLLPALTCMLRGKLVSNMTDIPTIIALVASIGGAISFLVISTIFCQLNTWSCKK